MEIQKDLTKMHFNIHGHFETLNPLRNSVNTTGEEFLSVSQFQARDGNIFSLFTDSFYLKVEKKDTEM